jgi:beta-lactamase superfamily II metal-dependent hydrolase
MKFLSILSLTFLVSFLSETCIASNVQSTVYEAEKATIADGATVKTDNSASGNKYVEIKDSGSIKWYINVKKTGRYLLVFRFKCSGGDKVQNIIINNEKNWSIGFPLFDGKWSTIKWYTQLNAGDNSIEITKNWDYTDFDSLAVSTEPILNTPIITPNNNIFYKSEPRDINIKIELNGHSLKSIKSNDENLPYITGTYKYQEFAERITITKDAISSLPEGDNIIRLIFDDNSHLNFNLKIMKDIIKHKLNIIALDVNHGNSVVIFLPDGKVALVDSGKESYAKNVVMPFLDRCGIKKLDYYILTHYHDDHWGAMDEIKKKYSVPANCFFDYNSVKTADVLNFGGTTLKILNSFGDVKDGKDENGNSISFKLEYEGFIYTHGADIYGNNQKRILEDFPNDIKADVYYTNHHLHGSLDVEYMRQTNPYLFITSAQEAVYARGAYASVFKEDVVDYLKNNNGRLLDDLLTLEVGSVVIRVNSGEDWSYEEYLSPTKIPVKNI